MVVVVTHMGSKSETTLPCSESVRDSIRSFKTGGESYDDVLRRMIDALEGE
jgi:hypothetical protein